MPAWHMAGDQTYILAQANDHAIHRDYPTSFHALKQLEGGKGDQQHSLLRGSSDERNHDIFMAKERMEAMHLSM